MKCSGVRHLLSAYLDGELDRGDELMVGQHLRRCHACADEVNALRQTIALCASLDEVEVPADFRTDLRTRLIALGPPAVAAVPTRPLVPAWRRTAGRWALPAAAAAAFAVAVGIGPYMADEIAPLERAPVQEAGQTVDAPRAKQAPTAQGPVATEQTPAPVEQTPSDQPQAGENTQPTEPVTEHPETVTTNTQPPTAVNPHTANALTASDTPVGQTDAPVAPQYALSASVHLSVADMEEALSGVKDVASQYSGSVAEGTGTYVKASRTYNGILVSVPAEKLEAFLADVAKKGTVVSGGSVARQDYGSEIAQTGATLTEARGELQAVKGDDEFANAHRESLRERIDDLEEQLQALQTKIAIAAVELTLEESRQSSLLH